MDTDSLCPCRRRAGRRVHHRPAASLIRTQGIGDLFRIHYEAVRDGLDYYWTAIPDSFDVKAKEAFDPDYMQKLVEIGYRRAKTGNAWQPDPPQ